MKKSVGIAAALCVAIGFSSAAYADLVTFGANVQDFGGAPSDNVAATPELVVSHIFALPAILSLDAVHAQLAHDFGSDVTIELIAPGGGIHFIALGDGPPGSPHQGPGDTDELGNNGTG
ncbi:MAG TPA: hypothetical protein VNT79_10120, partial [Phycisphaerae bacterium]|nr:hypothetical protein [Phycisphaerae bacterium]